jgi:nicotinamidase-related amidase
MFGIGAVRAGPPLLVVPGEKREARSVEHNLSNPALRRQYDAAGFGGRVGWGSRPALLVIDMAGAWTSPSEQLGSDLSGVMRSILELLPLARQQSIPIYFTTMAYGSPDEAGEVVCRKLPHTRHMLRDSARVQLAPELDRQPDEPLIEKPRASAFFATNLLAMLIAQRVDTVIVTGCSTSGCIRGTCESAHNYNFHVIVPREAVGDRSASAHEANLFDIDARYGDVVSLQYVRDHLRSLETATFATAEAGDR